jgi:hypothetical protein
MDTSPKKTIIHIPTGSDPKKTVIDKPYMHHYLRHPVFLGRARASAFSAPAACSFAVAPPPRSRTPASSQTPQPPNKEGHDPLPGPPPPRGKRAVAKGDHRYRQGRTPRLGPPTRPPAPRPLTERRGHFRDGSLAGGAFNSFSFRGGERWALSFSSSPTLVVGRRGGKTLEPGESPRATRQRVPQPLQAGPSRARSIGARARGGGGQPPPPSLPHATQTAAGQLAIATVMHAGRSFVPSPLLGVARGGWPTERGLLLH